MINDLQPGKLYKVESDMTCYGSFPKYDPGFGSYDWAYLFVNNIGRTSALYNKIQKDSILLILAVYRFGERQFIYFISSCGTLAHTFGYNASLYLAPI